MRIPGYTLLIAAVLAAPACKKLEPQAMKEAKAQQAEAHDKRIKQACASQASYERLKALAFEKAKDVHRGDTALLDRLAATTVVRMENPVVKSRDEALNVTVCKGGMVIELPPGAEDAFNGEHRLTAEVEYAAQAAADGSGLVYSLDGAEPIIYRLAAVDLKVGAQVASATPAPVPAIETAQASPAPTLPSAEAAPPPRPSPTDSASPHGCAGRAAEAGNGPTKL